MPFARRGPFRPSSLSLRAVSPKPVLTGKGPLLKALAHALDGDKAATEFLRMVLWDAGMEAVPDAREPYQAFVRDEVLPRLMPLVRLEKLHDLVRRTIGEEGSMHPPPLRPHGAAPQPHKSATRRARVVIVESDAFRRIAISRELVRGGFDVEVVASPSEVLRVDAFHVVVLPLEGDGEMVARKLAEGGTRAGLVTYDRPDARSVLRKTIDAWPSDRVAVVPRDAPPATLCARVKIVVG